MGMSFIFQDCKPPAATLVHHIGSNRQGMAFGTRRFAASSSRNRHFRISDKGFVRFGRNPFSRQKTLPEGSPRQDCARTGLHGIAERTRTAPAALAVAAAATDGRLGEPGDRAQQRDLVRCRARVRQPRRTRLRRGGGPAPKSPTARPPSACLCRRSSRGAAPAPP